MLKFTAENWAVTLCFVLITLLLAVGYRYRTPIRSRPHGAAFYAANTLVLGVAAGLCIAGARGGT